MGIIAERQAVKHVAEMGDEVEARMKALEEFVAAQAERGSKFEQELRQRVADQAEVLRRYQEDLLETQEEADRRGRDLALLKAKSMHDLAQSSEPQALDILIREAQGLDRGRDRRGRLLRTQEENDVGRLSAFSEAEVNPRHHRSEEEYEAEETEDGGRPVQM